MSVSAYRWHKGFLMPRQEPDDIYDRRTRDVAAIDRVLPFLKQRRTVIQAGGNWGYWPFVMARKFERVVTFEPDPTTFTALCINTRLCNNVMRFQAALGERSGEVSLSSSPERTGRQHVIGAGMIPQVRIDDLRLSNVDLIYLDIEGMEFAALKGAEATIREWQPLIAFEDKELGNRYYGEAEGAAREWLTQTLGYRELSSVSRNDRLWGPENHGAIAA